MSVFVQNFKPGDGTWTVVHDDAPGGSHSGPIDPATVQFAKNIDGTDNPLALVIECPVAGCGSVSTHPVGGGAQPVAVQETFARFVRTRGCPCGTAIPANRPFAVVQAHIRNHTEKMDGTGRWQVQGPLTP